MVGSFLFDALPKDVLQCLGWNDRKACVAAALAAPRMKDAVEYFCGTGGMTAAFVEQRLRCDWFDVILEPEQDICAAEGFAIAVRKALSIVLGGVAWFGVPCSTFVWVARGHTKRSRASPLGDASRADVRSANVLVRRVGVLLCLLRLRNVFFIVEQPAGSLLWQQPAMKFELRNAGKRRKRVWARCFLWLCHYGQNICKPTELRGRFPGLRDLLPSKRPKNKSKVGIYRVWVSKGRKRVKGDVGLKATEHYPTAFCRAVALRVLEVLKGKTR